MKRVLLALTLASLAAAGESAVAVPAPVPNTAVLVQEGPGPHRSERAQDPDTLVGSDRYAGDLEDCQESLDLGLLEAVGAPGLRSVWRRPPRGPLSLACPNLLFSAPKTGPPPLLALQR